MVERSQLYCMKMSGKIRIHAVSWVIRNLEREKKNIVRDVEAKINAKERRKRKSANVPDSF